MRLLCGAWICCSAFTCKLILNVIHVHFQPKRKEKLSVYLNLGQQRRETPNPSVMGEISLNQEKHCPISRTNVELIPKKFVTNPVYRLEKLKFMNCSFIL
jgi:hypothetical protein